MSSLLEPRRLLSFGGCTSVTTKAVDVLGAAVSLAQSRGRDEARFGDIF